MEYPAQSNWHGGNNVRWKVLTVLGHWTRLSERILLYLLPRKCIQECKNVSKHTILQYIHQYLIQRNASRTKSDRSPFQLRSHCMRTPEVGSLYMLLNSTFSCVNGPEDFFILGVVQVNRQNFTTIWNRFQCCTFRAEFVLWLTTEATKT